MMVARWHVDARFGRKQAVLANFATFFGDAARTPQRYIEKDWSNEVWSRGCYTGFTGPGVLLDYGPAIRRWEHVTGRSAPRPVDDRGRLAPVFVEWMMGLPAGWVTDVDIPRTAQLKALGNGVVPPQAYAEWRRRFEKSPPPPPHSGSMVAHSRPSRPALSQVSRSTLPSLSHWA